MVISSSSTITQRTQNFIEISSRVKFLQKRANDNKFKLFVSLLALLLIIFIICFAVTQHKYNQLLSQQVCTTEDCIATAWMLQQAIDPKIDPCEDFFAYACGNFPRNFPIAPNKLSSSWFDIGEEKILQLTKVVLEGEPTCPMSKPSQLARNFYKSCKDSKEIEKQGLKPLFRMLEMIGLPKYPTTESVGKVQLGRVLAMAQKFFGMDIFVAFGVTKGGEQNDTTYLEVSIRYDPCRKKDSFVVELNVILYTESDGQLSSLTYEIKGYTFLSQTAFSPYLADPDVNELRSTKSLLSPGQIALERISFMSNVIGEIVDVLVESNELEEEFNHTKLASEAFRIVSFSSELAMLDNNSIEASTTLTTVGDFQRMLEESVTSNRIDFKLYITTVFHGTGVNYTNSDPLTIISLDKFKELMNFLATAKIKTLVRYVWWWLVEKLAPLSTFEMKRHFDNYRKVLTGLDPPSRETQCLAQTKKYLGTALAYDFATKIQYTTDTKKVDEMLSNIVSEFEHLIYSLDWMEHGIQELNIRKVRAVKKFVGFDSKTFNTEKVEEVYLDLDFLNDNEYLINYVKISKWRMLEIFRIFKKNSSIPVPASLLSVNAFYSRLDNAIYIPLGILQRPFYYRGLESLNYGAIGTILGHELTHGFDNEGKNYDEHGQLQEKIWSDQVTEEYSKRADCFVQQYETFNISSNQRLNGTFTLSENIADNGGLRESIRAYQSYLRENDLELKLPGFENFTPFQLLFLSYANIWCDVTSEKFRAISALDSHSPNRVRILATLQNSQEFSDAFQCKIGSPMNPKKKCILW